MSKREKFDPYKSAPPAPPPKEERGPFDMALTIFAFILGWKIYDWIKAYFDF